MASEAPEPRYVRCPKCRNVLQEANDVPIYQCGVCDTILLAKHWKRRQDSEVSSDSIKDFSRENELNDRSERDFLTRNDEPMIMSEDFAHCSTGHAGNTFDSEDGYHYHGEDLENVEKGNEIGNDAINHLGEDINKNLIDGRDAPMTIREESPHCSANVGNTCDSEDVCHKHGEELENEEKENGIGDEELNHNLINGKDVSVTVSKDSTHCSADAGNTCDSEDVCHNHGEELKNGEKGNGIGDEELNQNLIDGRDASMTIRAESPHFSAYVGNICDSEDVCHKYGEELENGEKGNEIGEEEMNHNLINGKDVSVTVSEDSTHCSTDAGNTYDSEDGCHKVEEELDNGEERDGTRNKAIDHLAEGLHNILINGKEESPPLKPEDKMEELVESSNQEVVLEEENATDGYLSNRASTAVMSPTKTSYPAQDRVEELAKGQYQFLSKHTSEAQEFSGAKGNDREMEGVSFQDKRSLNKTDVSEAMGRHTSSDTESTPQHELHTHRQESPGLPEGFHTSRSSVELDLNQSFNSQWIARNGSPSSMQGDIGHNRMELLRMVDELRYQLIESLDQGSEVDRRSHSVSSSPARRPPRTPLLSIHETKGELYQLSSAALRLSGQSRSPCVCCHVPQSPGVFSRNSLCMSCYHPSNSAGFPYNTVSNSLMRYESNLDQNSEPMKPQSKVKDQASRRHCRPILGGANFIICYNCLELLQLPVDFHLSASRSNKLRCSNCSEVLACPVRGKNHVPTAHHHPEQCGSSPASCYTSEIESGKHISRNSTDSIGSKDRRRQQLTLHQLMGYQSASEIIYEPSEGDGSI